MSDPVEEEIARALAEYLATDLAEGPFSDTNFVRAEAEPDGMVSLFDSESDAAWPVASFDVPQLAEWIAHSPLLSRVRAEARVDALRDAAETVHAEARWQQEQVMRDAVQKSGAETAVERLLVVETLLRQQADRIEQGER